MRPSLCPGEGAPEVYQGPPLSYNFRLIGSDLQPTRTRMTKVPGKAPKGQCIVVLEGTNSMHFAVENNLVVAH